MAEKADRVAIGARPAPGEPDLSGLPVDTVPPPENPTDEGDDSPGDMGSISAEDLLNEFLKLNITDPGEDDDELSDIEDAKEGLMKEATEKDDD